MLKFFRKIRRKLLDEGNLKRYLIYAVGEILLVVIGILIAVQINGWNEKRKNNNQEAAILLELSKNIESNIAIIRQTMGHDSISLGAIETLFIALENDSPYTAAIPSYFSHAIASYPTNLSNSTMETVRAKGVDIIQSEQIRNQVLGLFDIEYMQINEIYNTDQQSYNNAEQLYILKNFRISRDGTVPNDYSLLQRDQEVLNILSMRKLYREASFRIKQNAINKSEELLARIEKYLAE